MIGSQEVKKGIPFDITEIQLRLAIFMDPMLQAILIIPSTAELPRCHHNSSWYPGPWLESFTNEIEHADNLVCEFRKLERKLLKWFPMGSFTEKEVKLEVFVNRR